MQSLYQFISIQPSVLLQFKKKRKKKEVWKTPISAHQHAYVASVVLFYSPISAVNSIFELAVERYIDERCIF